MSEAFERPAIYSKKLVTKMQTAILTHHASLYDPADKHTPPHDAMLVDVCERDPKELVSTNLNHNINGGIVCTGWLLLADIKL